jgi:hypothetical protein
MNAYLAKTSVLDYMKWDVSTLTAADFTAEYVITNDIWDNYRNHSGPYTNEELPSLRKF